MVSIWVLLKYILKLGPNKTKLKFKTDQKIAFNACF